MTLNTTMLSFLRQPVVFAPEDETGAGEDKTKNTGGDTGAAGGDAGDDAEDKSTDDGVVLGGGTADGQGNSDGDGNSDDDAGDGDEGDEGNEEGAPDEYSFEDLMPEGIELDATMTEAMIPVFKDMNLTQEQANKLVSAYADVVAKNAEEGANALKDIVEGWKTSAKADKEIGGDNWDESVRIANSVISKFGTDELRRDFLVGQGNGNHPEMIRLMARIGKAMGDDQLVTGEETDTSEAIPTETRWYGNTTPAQKKG